MQTAAVRREQTQLVRSTVLGDARSARILAKTIYRELRSEGLDEREVLSIASELLGLVAEEVRGG